MKQLINRTLQRLNAGERVVLCSVLQSDGSAPREAGAKMAVFADGSTLGTVGGGALERLAGLYALELLKAGRSGTKRYVLRPNKQEDIGMVCGGDVLLGFQCLRPDSAAELAALTELAAALDRVCSAWLRTAYTEDGAEMSVITREDVHGDGQRLPDVPTVSLTRDGTVLLEPVSKRYMVYLFGGGHVGRALVPVLASVGFPVTVYDARPEFAVPERYPLAARVVQGPFEDISGVEIRPEDYVVVMTPGHKADYEVLAQALRTEAAYIGCIGSARKAAFVNQRLLEAGFTQADLARIHSPIGLPILAQTPEEIAVSITAEMILQRRGG